MLLVPTNLDSLFFLIRRRLHCRTAPISLIDLSHSRSSPLWLYYSTFGQQIQLGICTKLPESFVANGRNAGKAAKLVDGRHLYVV